MDKLKMHTADITDANIQKIGELFPNCLTERLDENGKPERAIDFDKLKQELSKEIVEGNQERYQFTWPGKREAMRLANTPTNMTLRPCREDSVDFDNTENLYIEGDNLEVLKLLRENYLGKVKMIYIDPPYNTGNDFVYEDDYGIDSLEYKSESGNYDEYGNLLASRMQINTESNGRFHTDWLNMMYPRLKVARDLLKNDGTIFISIDDNELFNLKKICDEIFGSDAFVNCIAVKMSEATGVKMNHQKRRFPKLKEYILFYKMRDFSGFESIDKYKILDWDKENNIYIDGLTQNDRDVLISLEESEIHTQEDVMRANEILRNAKKVSLSKVLSKHNFSSEEEKNEWLFSNSYRIIKTAGSSSLSKVVQKLPSIPNQEIACAISNDGVLFFYITDYNRDTDQPRLRVIFADSNIYKNPCDFWQDIKTSGGVAKEGGVLYKNGKKPLQLLNRIVKMCTTENDIVMDFFSGSATTAHSVMYLNSNQKTHRKFILVQLPESLDETIKKVTGDTKKDIQNQIEFLDSIRKPHYLTELGKERIRRSGKIIQDYIIEHQNDIFLKNESFDIDTGFRVLKLDTSNMEDVYYKPEEFSELQLFEDNVKPDRTPEDLLFQVMLECNLPLSAKIEKKTIAGKEVFNVNEGYLIACFDKDVNEEVITEVAKQQPYYFVMRDKSLSSDNVADNFEQIFNAYSKDTIRKIL